MDAQTVLIDTSLFIEHIRARDKANTLLFKIHQGRHRLLTSSIVVAELCYGARSQAMRAEVEKVLFPVQVFPFTREMAFRISTEAQELKTRNAVIGFRDLAIACVALQANLPVATHNKTEFGAVAGLRLFQLE